jgi:hypothetical protein
LRALATKHNWDIGEADGTLHLGRDKLSTRFHVQQLDDETGFVYLSCRTTSWELPGERTDMHDIFSVLLAAYLRTRRENYSATLWDVSNPAVPVPETELYARYLTLTQPWKSMIRTDPGSLVDFETLWSSVEAFEWHFPRLFTWERANDQNYAWEGDVEYWGKHVAHATHEKISTPQVQDDDRVQFNKRWGPDWLYYRSIRTNTTVLASAHAACSLEELFTGQTQQQVIMGPNRQLYISPRVKSAVPVRVEHLGRELLKRLNGTTCAVTTMPLENKVVFVGGIYIVVLARHCGCEEFRAETQRIEQRHRREASVLFPASHYTWSEPLPDDRFELLIRELLEQEPGVERVRKVGHSRDADRGKDLLADWYTTRPPETSIPDGCAPGFRRKVVVQVKATAKAVNKDSVRDIRDTMDDHQASGYFLAVASHLTSDLTDHLDRLRSGGIYWADWWNRAEIEERLNRYPEIAQRFTDVVHRIDLTPSA